MFAKSVLTLVAVLSLAATAAIAHPHIVSASPAQNGDVTGSPKAVSIKFNEAPAAAFSAITVTDAAGKPVKTGKTAIDKADKATLTASVGQALAPGVYTVNWKAAGSDTHKVAGTYNFTVK